MPIRFRCSECGQLLAIARRKAGTTIDCPRCSTGNVVPDEETARAELAEAERRRPSTYQEPQTAPDDRQRTSHRAARLFEHSKFEQWIGKPDDDEGADDAPEKESNDPFGLNRRAQAATLSPVNADAPSLGSPAPPAPGGLSARFRTLMNRHAARERPLIGITLTQLVFALAGMFMAGLFVGRMMFPIAHGVRTTVSAVETPRGKEADNSVEAKVPAPPRAASGVPLTGRIRYKDGDTERPDDGALVMMLSASQQPAKRIDVRGLRFEDQGAGFRPGLEQLRAYRGDVTYVDKDGTFSMMAAEADTYYVLVLSRAVRRDPAVGLDNADRAVLGQYLAQVEELIGDRQYILVTRDASRFADQPVNYVFGR